MRTYRTGFWLALLGNLILVVVFGVFLWHTRFSKLPPQPLSSVEAPSAQPEGKGATETETPLAPVQISAQRLQSIGVKISEVREKNIEDEIRTTGNVAVNETGVAYVQTRFPGYIQKVFANATYQYIRKGQPLFTIYSPELVATEREYLVAKHNQQQVAQSTVPGVAASASSLVEAAAARLKQWGVPEKEIKRLESTGEVQQELEVDSPVSGYITERNAFPNLTVQPETRLYAVADLSTVWVQAQVFQGDLQRIRVGGSATLSVDTFPRAAFVGRVDFIYPQVDMDTRTAKVRIVFPNPRLRLKPGMFVNVVLKASLGRQLVIPGSGILQTGSRAIAFVDRGDGYLEPRELQLGSRAGDDFIVVKGVKAGEKIVTSANFLIDSESQLQAALGSFVPPPPGAGASSVMNTSNTPQSNAELSSEPNPPQKGNNLFRVKLADANGATVTGAEVTVTFFMPAMPAMGMAAMRTPVPLNDKGNGLYEGSGRLDSGGTWQVTVVARKSGQVIANKQMTISATGGM